MATREENLKKINDELEKMTDEELDQVAGGNATETANDSCFLNSLGGFCDRYGKWRIMTQNHNDEIRNAWSKVGVDAKIHGGNLWSQGKPNVYKINGRQITQEEARQHAMKVTGHHMTEKDWYW